MVERRREKAVTNMVLILCVALMIAIAFYYLTTWALNLYRAEFGLDFYYSRNEILFIQGILLTLSGLVGFIGRIKEIRTHGRPQSLREIFWGFRVFMWVPSGYPRIGLTLILAGIIIILIYFSSP